MPVSRVIKKKVGGGEEVGGGERGGKGGWGGEGIAEFSSGVKGVGWFSAVT